MATVSGLQQARSVLVVRYVLLAYTFLMLGIVRVALFSQHYEKHFQSNVTWLLTAHAIAFIPMNIIMGVVADKIWGRTKTMLFGLAVCTAAYSLNVFASSLLLVCCAEFLYGIGEASFTATVGAWFRYNFSILYREEYKLEHKVKSLSADHKKDIRKKTSNLRNLVNESIFGWKYPLAMVIFPVILILLSIFTTLVVIGWFVVVVCLVMALFFFVVDPLGKIKNRKEIEDETPAWKKFKQGLRRSSSEFFRNKLVGRLSLTGVIHSASWSALLILMFFEVYRSELVAYARVAGIIGMIFAGLGQVYQNHSSKRYDEVDEVKWMNQHLFTAGLFVFALGVVARFDNLVILKLVVFACVAFMVGRFSNLFMGAIFDFVQPGREGDRTGIMSFYLSIDKTFVLGCNLVAYIMTERYSLGGSAMMLVLAFIMIVVGSSGWIANKLYRKKATASSDFENREIA